MRPGPTVLTITGKVNAPLNLALSDLDGYTQKYAMWQNNAGNSSYSGTGPLVIDLLGKAGLKSDAANVSFTSTDPANSMTTTVTLADLNSKYKDSIVAYNWSGIDKNGVAVTNTNKTLQLIMPAGGGKNQVKDITQITVS